MAYRQAFDPMTLNVWRLRAIGLVRSDVSGPRLARYAAQVRRHSCGFGHRYIYTVYPPADESDPIGYGLGMAAGLGVDVIVVFDLAHVDDQPTLICDEGYDLETVCPHRIWTRSDRPLPEVGVA